MWHYGETVGFRTTIQRFVDEKLTVVVLCNRDDLVPAVLALKVANLFLAPQHGAQKIAVRFQHAP
jgi:hypothetical protein